MSLSFNVGLYEPNVLEFPGSKEIRYFLFSFKNTYYFTAFSVGFINCTNSILSALILCLTCAELFVYEL